MKWLCGKCGEVKFKKDFIPSTKFANGRASTMCKACKTAYNTAWIKKRREDPEYRKKHNESARKTRVWHYGLSEDDYEAILDLQGGGCAGCGRPPTEGRNLDIDHEHQLGEKQLQPVDRLLKVRGLLCHRCNRLLGLSGDDSSVLRRLADFLDDPPAHHVTAPLIYNLLDYMLANMSDEELAEYERLKAEDK